MSGSHARKHRTHLDEHWRERIRITMIIKRLQDHVAGKRKMTVTQVRAAEVLLRKVAPDLSDSRITGEVKHTLEELVLGSMRQPVAAVAVEKVADGKVH